MSRGSDMYSRLAGLAAGLSPQTDRKSLTELESLLARSRFTDAATDLFPHALSVDRASWYSPEALSAERRRQIEEVLARPAAADAPQYRVFRRESPVAASMINLATPP